MSQLQCSSLAPTHFFHNLPDVFNHLKFFFTFLSTTIQEFQHLRIISYITNTFKNLSTIFFNTT